MRPRQLFHRLQEGRKMRKLVVTIVALVFFLGLPGGCADSSKQKQGNEKPIGVRKQHDTRVFILCKDSRGEYYEKSLHKSAQVICGEKIFNLALPQRILILHGGMINVSLQPNRLLTISVSIPKEKRLDRASV